MAPTRHIQAAILAMVLLVSASSVEAAGMPQLNPNNFAPQLVWLALSFFVLYVVMARIALPKVSHVLEARQSRIEADLKQAEQLKQEAEAAAASYEAGLADAKSQAQSTVREINQEMSAKAHEELSAVISRLTADVKAAEASIGEARNKAVGNLQAITVEVTQSVVARLAGMEIDAATAGKAVDLILKERR
ncbi:F0F1 ATP synthase subunit B family protein [Magnetospira thiophila]